MSLCCLLLCNNSSPISLQFCAVLPSWFFFFLPTYLLHSVKELKELTWGMVNRQCSGVQENKKRRTLQILKPAHH